MIDPASRAQLIALRRVRDRIDREFDRPLNVEELAAGVHMSAGHLSRRFRAAYGESPYSYLMTRRIERAMALIRRGDLSITDICYTVGFSSLGTFSTRFSELVGVSPRRYRSALEAGEHDLPTFIVKNVLRPVRNREVGSPEPD
ncbi:MAG: helix-turn-helix transcriptional regulator [Brevibacterium sp.]